MAEDEVKLPYNIKENVKNFLLDEVFHSCRTNKHFDFEAGMFMMVVDEKSISVLNTFVQYTDLMEKGVAGIERLELQRKRFPKMHAIYFLSSSKRSIDLLAKDFEDLTKPHYGFIHLIFYNGCSDDMLKYLMGKTNILSLIVNLKVIQLQFMAIDETTYTFGMSRVMNMLYTNDLPEQKEEIVDDIAVSISTLVTGLKDFHNIQVLHNKTGQGIAKIVADKVVNRLKNTLGQKSKPVVVPPPVTLIIMDRTHDLMTPLKHDTFYNSLIMDLLHIQDNKYEYESINEKQEKTIKTSFLNETDNLWLEHRKRGYLPAFTRILTNFKDFVKHNSAAQLQSGELGEMNIEKMGEIIRKMPQYQDMLGEYNFHIAMIERSQELFKRREISNIANIEAILCAGTDPTGKSKIIENPSACTNCEYPMDKVRMALLMLLSGYCEPSVAQTIKNSLKNLDESAQVCFDGLNKIGAELGQCKLAKKDVAKDAENKLAETDRAMSKLAEAVMAIRGGKDLPDFGKTTLPESETFPEVKFKKGALLASKLGAASSNTSSNPIFIVCVLGGISVNEIRELRCLEDHPECTGFTAIMGGTTQHTPLDYLKELQRIMGPLKEDIEAMKKEKQKEQWLQAEFEKDKKEAEEMSQNPGKEGETKAEGVELKEALLPEK